ncbi:ATP-binding protein, partial [Campylobacter jejuni]|nr:ATP-binding protein [Campylobacter jejuni]
INKNRFCINSKDKSYDLTNFSRGEELILYLISKILTIPNNEQQIIIIDEPELHLHPSLTNRLWDILEKHRQDCLFIYITHDLNFASSRTNSDKFWIKSYNGKNGSLNKSQQMKLCHKNYF